MSPKLSVIIPFYNGEEYVNNVYQMFLAQNSMDFELICVDDGSTDNTLNKLETMKNNCNMFDITVLHQSNKGVSSARNFGASFAKGEYISFVDCDDYISKDYISVLEKNCNIEFDIFVFQTERIKSNRIYEKKSKRTYSISKVDLVSRFIDNPTKFGVYNLFIDKDFYHSNDLSFKEGLKYYEDYEFLYRIFSCSQDILITERQLYYYVLRQESAMQVFNRDRIDSIEAIDALRPLISKQIPDVLTEFDLFATSRLYWSVMWQACLAFDFLDAKKFCELYDVKTHVSNLIYSNSKKVSLSTKMMLNNFEMYYLIVRLLGKMKSNIKTINLSDFVS